MSNGADFFALGNLSSHQLQLRKGRHAVLGDVMEHDAHLAEQGGGFTWRGFSWDYKATPALLKQAPWLRLPWVGTHCRRGHAPWPKMTRRARAGSAPKPAAA